MSAYFQKLDNVAKERYKEKLTCTGLNISVNLYLMENQVKFSSDMSLWPSIEYGHIFSYFINRPGMYTQEQLLSWKQLEAYNYSQNGYVREVKSMVFGKEVESLVVKALVNSSQRAPNNAHEPWLIAAKDGTILCAHCTCMAG